LHFTVVEHDVDVRFSLFDCILGALRRVTHNR